MGPRPALAKGELIGLFARNSADLLTGSRLVCTSLSPDAPESARSRAHVLSVGPSPESLPRAPSLAGRAQIVAGKLPCALLTKTPRRLAGRLGIAPRA